eukprot:CAMPEP_0171231456 /NCGR_PEP_ID=MMETSP0790-20130122/39910_1 /TAXON_ID=2925 /ORGANISM="Alexandrium catenella, Strain OF101" /LENGTH=136 /DNA_ID=CAMNT_0011697677 /DNA_START=77 /DNA_END=484 /DNA_ORIENTATION=+
MAIAKKPAAAMKRKGMTRLVRQSAMALGAVAAEEAARKAEEEPQEAEAGEDEAQEAEDALAEEEEPQETPEERQQRLEQEAQDQRAKELKAMALDGLKALAKRLGLDEKQKKAALVEAVVAHEAKIRADKAAHEAK